MGTKLRWAIGLGLAAVLLAVAISRIDPDSPMYLLSIVAIKALRPGLNPRGGYHNPALPPSGAPSKSLAGCHRTG